MLPSEFIPMVQVWVVGWNTSHSVSSELRKLVSGECYGENGRRVTSEAECLGSLESAGFVYGKLGCHGIP